VILCVCPGPAVDVTYHVDRLVPGATVRVGSVDESPGGKGVNVARVLHALGEPTLLVAPVGGETGEQLRQGLSALGVPARLVPDGAATRRTVTVVERDGGATCLVEPASTRCWPELLAAVEESLVDARVVVVSGRLSDGVPGGGLAALVSAAKARGLVVLADTHGPALVEALEAGCDVVKPNAEELVELTHDDNLTRAARDVCDRYAAAVVVSLGADGVLAVTPRGTWTATPGEVVTGNPTGAGDALVAGLARALHHDPDAFDDPEPVLRAAVALSVAAVRAPTAGVVDLMEHAATVSGVSVTASDGVR
jgi:tagatose 6-phosphate kinase